MLRQTSLALMACFLLGSRLASGQEWSRFRGPNGSGLSDTTFPSHFDAKDFAWNIELPGTGHSSPVLWGEKIFVTCAQEATAERMVVCLDVRTGAVAWKKTFASHLFRQHADNSYASSTPAVDEKHVYVCWVTPEEFTLTALNHDGTQAWSTNLGDFVSQHGGGNSPIVVGDTVILGDDQEAKSSCCFGIDAATGAIRWKTVRRPLRFSAATPLLFHSPTGGADTVVLTSQAEGMTGLDPATGKVVWQAPGLYDSRTVGSPVTGAGLIFATCGEGAGGHVLTAVRPNGNHADVVWKVKSETPYVPTPLVKGSLLFYWSDRGVVTCAHADTGAVIWQEHVPGSYYSSPICAGKTLFNVTKKGEVIAVAADEKFALLGQTALDDKCQATPAIAGSRMFIRTYTRLICVNGTAAAQAKVPRA